MLTIVPNSFTDVCRFRRSFHLLQCNNFALSSVVHALHLNESNQARHMQQNNTINNGRWLTVYFLLQRVKFFQCGEGEKIETTHWQFSYGIYSQINCHYCDYVFQNTKIVFRVVGCVSRLEATLCVNSKLKVKMLPTNYTSAQEMVEFQIGKVNWSNSLHCQGLMIDFKTFFFLCWEVTSICRQ